MTPDEKREFVKQAKTLQEAIREFAERWSEFTDHHAKTMLEVARRALDSEVQSKKGMRL